MGKVVHLVRGPSIPEVLRQLADEIEAGEFEFVPHSGVMVLEGEQDFGVYGLGEGDIHKTISLLTIGQAFGVNRWMKGEDRNDSD